MILEPKMRIHVEQRSNDCRASIPRSIRFGRHQVEVLEPLDQWYGPDYRYIKVRGHDGGLCILRFDEPNAEWALTMFKSARAQIGMA